MSRVRHRTRRPTQHGRPPGRRIQLQHAIVADLASLASEHRYMKWGTVRRWLSQKYQSAPERSVPEAATLWQWYKEHREGPTPRATGSRRLEGVR